MTETYLALYRKYRPTEFADVVGQEQIVTLLQNVIANNKVSHAYLFCGGRGTGKTTVARIFARDIGCNPEDIIELDAASNRGIDEVRELRDAVRTAPFSSPYKVYIIDEAHMLTKEAANALLKTLEEPPSHVIFILATTDPEKLPHTIVSRCQKVVFGQPDITTLSDRILHIAKKEGKTLHHDSALLIADHGNGSYRDAIGILEQVFTLGDSTVEHSKVISHLGVPEKNVLLSLIEAICAKDETQIINTIAILSENKTSAVRAYDMCIEYIRTILLVRIQKLSTEDEVLQKIAKEYPHTINSQLILTLLQKRELLLVSEKHAWTAFESISLSLI